MAINNPESAKGDSFSSPKTLRSDEWTKHKVLIVVLSLLTVAGIAFRFCNLERKQMWGDEALTLLWLSGHTQQQMHRAVCQSGTVNGDQLLAYQNASSSKDVCDTVRALAANSPMHAPVYYALARLIASPGWDSLQSSRTLAAVLSLLQIPFAVWLAYELSGCTLAATLAAVLLAISPFQYLYAQEAREYSAWSAVMLLSSAALLFAIRTGTRKAWICYGLSMVACLYVHLLSLLLVASHALFVFADRHSLNKGALKSFAVQSAFALVMFLPWLLIICCSIPIVQEHYQWVEEKIALADTVRQLFREFVRVFFDIDPSLTWIHGAWGTTAISILILVIEAYCVLVLAKKSRRAAVFLASMAIPIAFFLLLPDLIMGGVRSTRLRFWMPAVLALQLSVALAAAELLQSTGVARRAGIFSVAILVTASILSCVVVSCSTQWWHKDCRIIDKYFDARADFPKSTCYFELSTFADDMVLLVLGHYLGKDTVTIVKDSDIAELEKNAHGKAIILKR